MKTYRLAFVGFGNVNRTLLDLLRQKEAELRERYSIEWIVTGIASRRLGWHVKADGFNFPRGATVMAESLRTNGAKECNSYKEWLATCQPDVLFEATSLNVENGQPAIDHIRAALEQGAHAITANKGPIVHAYRELRDLAARHKRRFLFESTVMDGAPIFSLFRETLPAVQVRGFRGILNSTTNVVLTGMEQGLSFGDSLRRAQELGIAETDASYDIDGWDATVKVAALVNVIMDVPFRPNQIQREGIRSLTGDAIRSARLAGKPFKLVCRAERTASGVQASVGPEQVPLSDPLALVTGTSSIVHFETDVLPGLTITEENPGIYTTAYGMLADFIRAVS